MNKLIIEICSKCKGEIEQTDILKCLYCKKLICSNCFIFHLNEVHNDDTNQLFNGQDLR